MKPRIFLVHPYIHSMATITDAFRATWPEAEAVNLYDESLYVDVGADDSMPGLMHGRLVSLFRHCELSGADGIIFTGSAFGFLVDTAKSAVRIPVLKPDEAMAEIAVREGSHLLLACTAKQAIPIIRRNIDAAASVAGRDIEVRELWIPDAQSALSDGKDGRGIHDHLIAKRLERETGYDLIVFGQISMASAVAGLPEGLADCVLTTPEAAIRKMRMLLENE